MKKTPEEKAAAKAKKEEKKAQVAARKAVRLEKKALRDAEYKLKQAEIAKAREEYLANRASVSVEVSGKVVSRSEGVVNLVVPSLLKYAAFVSKKSRKVAKVVIKYFNKITGEEKSETKEFFMGHALWAMKYPFIHEMF